MTTVEYSLTKSEFDSIYSRVPRLCVEIIILDHQKGVLLTKRAIEPAKGAWHTPGGTVRYQESLEEAARRIAKKELGVGVEIIKELGVIEAIFTAHYSHDVSVAIEVRPSSETFLLDEQADEFKFFKELPEKMIPAQREFLEKHLHLK